MTPYHRPGIFDHPETKLTGWERVGDVIAALFVSLGLWGAVVLTLVGLAEMQ